MNIGLIAFESKKSLMQNLCIAYRNIFSKHNLYSTETTGRLIEEVTNLNIHKYLAGYLGGEEQIASQIEQNNMDMIIYLREPSIDPRKEESHSHDIVRLCDLHNIPVATNLATAELLVKALDRGDLDWRNYV